MHKIYMWFRVGDLIFQIFDQLYNEGVGCSKGIYLELKVDQHSVLNGFNHEDSANK